MWPTRLRHGESRRGVIDSGPPAQSRSATTALNLAWTLGALVAAVGVVVLVGWALDVAALKTVLPGLASMKVNTAIGFVAGGGGLALVVARPNAAGWLPLHRAMAFAIAALALLTLIEYAAGFDFGIDELIVADPGAPPNTYPGRMSVITAADFILFAAALGLVGARSRPLQIAFLAVASLGLLVSVCALVGYAFGVPVLYAPLPASSIGLHTAFAFALLFFGITAARPDLGWVALVTSDTPSGVLMRVLLPAVLGGPLLFGWAVLYGERLGLYDVQTGLALFTVLGGALMAGIVWWFGLRADRLDMALRNRQRLHNTVTETALDAFLLMDEAGRILEWNLQAERIFGWSAEEALGRPVAETIVPPAFRAAHTQGLARYLATGEGKFIGQRVEVQGWRRDGTEFPAELVIVPMRVDGRIIFSGFVRDLSGLRQTEEQLRRAQKLEAVGQLTGGIAHDFNNLLTVVIGSLDLVLERVPPSSRTPIENALKAAERGAALVRQLLAFSRRQTLAPQDVDFSGLVEEMEDVLRRTLGENVEIELRLIEDLWLAHSDRSQVENALLNLAINARDAMPDGGKLVIETANIHLDAEYAAHNLEVTPGDFVMLAVTDTGTGMPPDVLERAFEPFFSTKEPGKGSGLGLSMIYGFAKQSGGHAKLYSEVGHGTTVRLYLPRAAGEAEPRDSRAAATSAEPHGNETILVVEDSAQVRELVASQLGDLGYRVLEAADGPQALKHLEDGVAIDLLFTDVVMPGGMTGKLLAKEAARRRPALKVLFTSGYTENSIVHQGRLDPGVNFLSKPYKRRDLAEMVRSVLDARA